MALDIDCRCSLEFELPDLDNQFASVEEALDKACNQLEAILLKISQAEAKLEAARRANKVSVVSMLGQRIKMFKSMYNIYYQFAEQKSQQLLFLEQERLQGKNHDSLSGGISDDFTW